QIKQYLVETLFVVIRSYGLIMSITFVEMSIGLSVIGIPNAVLVALLISVFDILPVLGTGGIMIPWTIITLFQGNYQTGLSLLFVYLVITVVRNILEPKIVGKQLGLHPVVTLMCIFVGANLFGVIGLFGFPITLSLLRHLNDTGTIQLFK
ncbi:MAG: AI-2E family transporter, partial [Eubacteriales bacterium]|nr:AI-2E family transporter [Eubacteriales bacterium]